MADVSANISWTGESLTFEGGGANGPRIRIDGSGATGPSPLITLLLSFGGCMAADIVDISTKGRTQFSALEVAIEGDRATEVPRRYTRIAMRFTVAGANAEDEPKFQRALDLSREKYCSVLHSLREDIALEFNLELI
ncbi:MAG: OsmC family protein [Longimicrobiales bacterium]